jgi:hypothetical protein
MSQILSPNRYAGRLGDIRLIVLHTMEVAEADSVAEAVGNAFAKPATRASAHTGVDTDSECRYVADADTAWAAPGANADGLQLEMAGRAGQTTGQWTDAGSKAILERAAQRTATWCRTHDIPARRLTDAQLAAGLRGIVGHDQVSRVYKRSTHWDPGPNFPWASFLARVNVLLKPAAATPAASATARPITLTLEDDMPVILRHSNGHHFISDTQSKREMTSPAAENAYLAAGVKVLPLPDAEINSIPLAK